MLLEPANPFWYGVLNNITDGVTDFEDIDKRRNAHTDSHMDRRCVDPQNLQYSCIKHIRYEKETLQDAQQNHAVNKAQAVLQNSAEIFQLFRTSCWELSHIHPTMAPTLLNQFCISAVGSEWTG